MSKGLKKNGRFLLPILMAEDISGAFESIDHEAICRILELRFNSSEEFNIGGAIWSFLERQPRVKSRETDETLEIHKKFAHKTAPQGSSLSPLLWRFYDAIFTKIYKDNLDALKADPELSDFIHSYKHVAYADDHLTVLVLSLPRSFNDDLIKRFTSEVVGMCRDLLDSATVAVGCSINREKSEVVIADEWANSDVSSKSEFVWLGYGLKMTCDLRLMFTHTKMNLRFRRVLGKCI